MTNRSRFKRAKRAQETQRAREIQTEWYNKMPAETAKEFTRQVEAARARGPAPRPPDMAPGTAPNPPRPGREPKPPKDQRSPRRRTY
jgi:hypothetical protein